MSVCSKRNRAPTNVRTQLEDTSVLVAMVTCYRVITELVVVRSLCCFLFINENMLNLLLGVPSLLNDSISYILHAVDIKIRPSVEFLRPHWGHWKPSKGYWYYNDMNFTLISPIVLSGCLMKYTTAVGNIKSPVIPDTYHHDVHCTWKVIVPKHLKLSMSVTLPWAEYNGDNNDDCSSYLLIHNNRYDKKHMLNTRKLCTETLDENIIMEKNTAIIDFFGKVCRNIDSWVYQNVILWR